MNRFFDVVDNPVNWMVDTRCAGWQVRDLVGHMIDVTEAYLDRWDLAKDGQPAPDGLGWVVMADKLNEGALSFRSLPREEAIVQAGRVRLRPIMMTTLALIAGMIPVAIGAGEGADFRAPLGRAIIGGVITSTFLTLLVIPTIYLILDDWRLKITGLFDIPVRPKTEEYMVPRSSQH